MLAVCCFAAAAAPPRAHAADLQATPSTFASVFAGAKGGDRILLATGDYGRFSGGSKSSMLTLAAQPGAIASIAPSMTSATNLTFDGLTIRGAYLNGARNVAFVNSTFTDMTRVDTIASIANANILFDHNTFDGINMCSSCYEGRLTVRGYNNTAPVGVTISNNHFGGGGQSDGIQVIGQAYGVQIGPGNEFANLKQGSFSAHVDPIQFYGDTHTTVTGNYFHGNSTGIMAGDGTDHALITNNVFVTDGEYPDQVVIGGGSNDVIRHNVFANGARVRIGKVNVVRERRGDRDRQRHHGRDVLLGEPVDERVHGRLQPQQERHGRARRQVLAGLQRRDQPDDLQRLHAGGGIAGQGRGVRRHRHRHRLRLRRSGSDANAHAEPDADSHADTKPDADRGADSEPNAHADAHPDADTEPHADAHPDSHLDADADAQPDADTDAPRRRRRRRRRSGPRRPES